MNDKKYTINIKIVCSELKMGTFITDRGVSKIGARDLPGYVPPPPSREKKTLYTRVKEWLPYSNPALIVGILLVIIGLLLLFMRNRDMGDVTEDVEVAYVGSIILVGVALIFV